MPKNNRTWLIALVLVLIAGGGAIVLRRTVFRTTGTARGRSRSPSPRIRSAPAVTSPARSGCTSTTRGRRSASRSARPAEPWQRSLKVDLNGFATTVERGKPVAGKCGPTVTAEPTSLLTRLDYDRSCLQGDTSRLTATVTVDGAAPVRGSAKKTAQPNVLMIMVDDMRTDELQWMPNVQRLIGEQGVTFNNGFASLPLCCPARASVLTGSTPTTTASGRTSRRGASARCATRTPSRCGCSGPATTRRTWASTSTATARRPSPARTAAPPRSTARRAGTSGEASVDGGMDPDDPQDGGTYRFFDTTLNDNCNGYLPLKPTYQTTAYTKLAREQLVTDKEQGKPWLNYISFTAPHHGAPAEPDDPDYLVTPARPPSGSGVRSTSTSTRRRVPTGSTPTAATSPPGSPSPRPTTR